VEIVVSASLLPPDRSPPTAPAARTRTPMRFVFRIDMLRGSDKVLMASSLVRKAVNVPGDAKAVLLEADRFLAV
jgi:hypothetical protein